MTTEPEMAVNLELARSYRVARDANRYTLNDEPDPAELASWAEQYWYTAQNALEVYARNMREHAHDAEDDGLFGPAAAFREAAARAGEAAAALAQVMEGRADPE